MSEKRSRSRSSKRRVTFSGGSYRPAGYYWKSERVAPGKSQNVIKQEDLPPTNVIAWLVISVMITVSAIAAGLDMSGYKVKNHGGKNEHIVKERQQHVSSLRLQLNRRWMLMDS